jgi:hypothetical protein
MSFGATFEGDEPAPDDEPQVASSGHYLAQQRRHAFETAWAAHVAGEPNLCSYNFIKEILSDIDEGILTATEDQRAWLAAEALAAGDENADEQRPVWGPVRSFLHRHDRQQRDPRLDAYAVNQARAAATAAHPDIGDMNIVITLTDAARVFAYRGLNELSRRLKILADRFEPIR